MAVKIGNVEKHSPSYKKGIRSGDTLVSFNGNEINDFLDYSFYASPELTVVEFINKRGHTHRRKLRFDGETSSIGMEFESFLMDRQHSCKNKCIFCFIDQMPSGMRESLYFKDDDSRLSFLFGNYITLTNLSELDVQRIIKMHISPINISVHTMNPELRVKMMLNPNSGLSLQYLKEFADAGIKMNTQLVLCPGINDGEQLKYSLAALSEYYPFVQSIAAVPVGLTKYRQGLCELKSYMGDSAAEVLKIIDDFNEAFIAAGKERIAFASDEFYLTAGRTLPSCTDYGEFCQLDNGVGMCVLLESEFMDEMALDKSELTEKHIGIATGELAYPLIKKLCESFMQRHPKRKIEVYSIKNEFFGESVTVAGLITGGDLIKQLKDREFALPSLLIPEVMLKRDEDIFLDDITLEEAEKELNTRIYKSGDGRNLYQLLSEV